MTDSTDDGRPTGVIGRLMRAYGVCDVHTLAIRMGQSADAVLLWQQRDELPPYVLRREAEKFNIDPDLLAGLPPG